MRVLILAESPEGAGSALQEFDQVSRKHPLQGTNESLWGRMGVLLGKKELARVAFEKSVIQPGLTSEATKQFRAALPQFARGDLSEEQYRAKAGTSRFYQSIAHYDIGIFRLAAGDRAGAREHFRKAVARRTFWIWDYFWCAMFLSRLESDPRWPPWIPVKE